MAKKRPTEARLPDVGLTWAGRLQLAAAAREAGRRKKSERAAEGMTVDGLPLRFEPYGKTGAAKTEEPPLTFHELKAWAKLKARLKRGPRLTRKQRAKYLLNLARNMGVGAK